MEEKGGDGETIRTSQGFKAVSYSLALIKIGTARTIPVLILFVWRK